MAFERCTQEGLCLGHLIEVQKNVQSMEQCTDICRNFKRCKFASFHQTAMTCTLSKACSQVVLKNQPYKHQSPTKASKCTRKIFSSTTVLKVYSHSYQFLAVSKILTVGGDASTEEINEITSLDLNATCGDFPEESFGIGRGAVSGSINDRPTFCGGYGHGQYPVYCYQYYHESKTFNRSDSIKLNTGAFEGAYAQWRDSGIIVVGGRNGAGQEDILDTIQIVTEGRTETWNLHEKSLGSCLVHLYDDAFLLISGLEIGARSIIIEQHKNGKLISSTTPQYYL